jgi:hypothetical protein
MHAPPRRTRPIFDRCRALGAVSVVAWAAIASGCAAPRPSPDAAPDDLVALVATADSNRLLGWDAGGDDAVPIDLPGGEAAWVATGRADVLAAIMGDGSIATSDPVRLGKKLAWRTVHATGPNGDPPKGPYYFASWDPEGGRFATLAGDVVAGDDVRIVLIDPSVGTAFEIAIEDSVVGAPPAWIDADRLVVVTGDAGQPTSTIVDTTTSESTEGPIGARLIATSANGGRVATMAGQAQPIVIHDTGGWLAGDGSSIASIDPPDTSTTAIAFALDTTGDRLAIAWVDGNGAVTLAIHAAASAWRRVARPSIADAEGAVVAWRR